MVVPGDRENKVGVKGPLDADRDGRAIRAFPAAAAGSPRGDLDSRLGPIYVAGTSLRVSENSNMSE